MDFAELGNGSTTERQYWIESMEVALSATDHIIEGGTINVHRDFEPAKQKRQQMEGTVRIMAQNTEDDRFLF